MAQGRRPVLLNRTTSVRVDTDASVVESFHSQLPSFEETPLTPLADVARQLGVKSVFLKDESSRLGLPAFKILGASWGAYRAIVATFGLPDDAPLEDVATIAKERRITLFAASEGNHGRALAAMARMLGVQSHIYVPYSIHETSVAHIASEGAQVTVSKLDYDGAMMEALAHSKTTPGGLFIQDSSFDGYEQIPRWIVEGYSTLLAEAKQQLARQGLKHDIIVTPVGVGSLAHAVVRHSKSTDQEKCAVLTVEPDTAPCLYKSLQAHKMTPVQTAKSIMEGLNCGTVSLDAFEDLKAGVDAAATVSDYEAHEAVQFLATKGIKSGPCGAATIAALWRLAEVSPRPAWLNPESVVVVINTEGPREYTTPLDVAVDDPVQLTQTLTRIDSSNPDLSRSAGAGENAIANYIFAWLHHRDLEAHWLEKSPGRPSVVGVLRGKGTGKSLMLNGHMDTVSLSSYGEHGALSGELSSSPGADSRIYGRGSLDMKAGVAASMAALARIRNQIVTSTLSLPGDLIFAAVADEENLSQGTEGVLDAGWKADAAIIPEPTDQALVVSHKGFAWVQVDILGVAAHGSLPDEGVDAILLAGLFQSALLDYAKTLPSDPRLGKASLHGGRIVGGEEVSSYPSQCTLTIEFRTIPGQTTESIIADLEKLLREISGQNPKFRYNSPRLMFSRPPSDLRNDSTIVETLLSAASKVSGTTPVVKGEAFWTDAGLLNEAGIPTVLYGPRGAGLHGKDEWVSVESVQEVTTVLEATAKAFLLQDSQA